MEPVPTLRTLLPAVTAGPSRHDAELRRAAARGRRTNVAIACNECRRKKRACDGREPRCTPCEKKSDQHCVYRSDPKHDVPAAVWKEQFERLQQQFDQHTGLLENLKLLPENQAIELLLRIRSPDDITSSIASVDGSFHQHRSPSAHDAARGILPPTDSRLEFELSVSHQSVYHALKPLDPASLAVFPFQNSRVRQSSNLAGLDQYSQTPAASQEYRHAIFAQSRPSSQPRGPLAPSEYCDVRLRQVEVGYWTKIPISQELAACVLDSYFRGHHPVFGFFDADLFLDDFVARRLEFCSPFLVSALLCLSCLLCKARRSQALELSSAFLLEAEAFERAEYMSDSHLNVAAKLVLCIACIYLGKDDMGQRLLRDSRRMAERMHLFSIPPDTTSVAPKFTDLSADDLRAASHTAWGAYNWLTIHSFFYHGDPIDFPPVLPIPGIPDGTLKNQHGKTWQDHGPPSYMGQTFTLLCKFFTITQEIAAVYFAQEGIPIAERVPLAFAEAKYHKLLVWADSVSQEIERGASTSNHMIFFQMWYHCTILDIFRPFIEQGRRLSSFSAPDSTPETVSSASLKQIQRLLLLYYAEKPEGGFNAIINFGLMRVAGAVLDHPSADWKFYFMLCVRFWQELYAGFPVFGETLKAYLSLAIRKGAMSSEEAIELVKELRQNGNGGNRGETKKHMVTTSAIVDFELAFTDPEGAQVSSIADKFDDCVLFDQFTTVNFESDLLDLSKDEMMSGTGARP